MFVFGLLEYLLRVIVRSIATLRSTRWPARKAIVTRSDFSVGLACQVVKVVYTYSVDGDHYGGTDRKPFVFWEIAEINAKGFSPGSEITVRVRPGDPSVPVFRYS